MVGDAKSRDLVADVLHAVQSARGRSHFRLLRGGVIMRLLVGISFIVAGLAVGATGLMHDAATLPTPQLWGEVASKTVPMQVAAPVPQSMASAIVILPAKDKPHPTAPLTESKGSTGELSLVRDLQHGLIRVDCYEGAANGIWTGPTRQAMKKFIDQVNARLPVDKPDAVLLALLQGHRGRACGVCPAGQEVSADRCQPSAIVARQAAKGTPFGDGASPPSVSDERPALVAVRSRKGARGERREAPIGGLMSIGAGAAGRPISPGTKLAVAKLYPTGHQVVQPRRERRILRHASPRSWTYVTPMRTIRYAYRPIRRPRGIAGVSHIRAVAKAEPAANGVDRRLLSALPAGRRHEFSPN